MTVLDQLIEGLADDSISTSSVLRKFLVVGSRLQSEPIKRWVGRELNGYTGTETPLEEYPAYRGPLSTPVTVTFVGPMNSIQRHPLRDFEVPDRMNVREALFKAHFGQPIAELQEMAKSEDGLVIPWPGFAVSLLREWSAEGEIGRMEFHDIHSAQQSISKAQLHGIIEGIRNTALMLALDLQSDLPRAGEVGGPTTLDKEVEKTVSFHFETHIHGGTNTVGMGENVRQYVQIKQGDSEAFLTALEKLGLSSKDSADLHRAIKEDGNQPGEAVKAFFAKLGAGLIQVGSEVSKPVAIEAAKALVSSFTGLPLL